MVNTEIDGRTDRHDEAYSRFLQFYESAYTESDQQKNFNAMRPSPNLYISNQQCSSKLAERREI